MKESNPYAGMIKDGYIDMGDGKKEILDTNFSKFISVKDNDFVERSGHPMFYELTERMNYIHSVKNQDYGGGDPLGNFKRSADELGITPFLGVLVRLSDKWSRISNIAKKGTAAVKDETIEDTLMDLAVYSLLAIILHRENKLAEKI